MIPPASAVCLHTVSLPTSELYANKWSHHQECKRVVCQKMILICCLPKWTDKQVYGLPISYKMHYNCWSHHQACYLPTIVLTISPSRVFPTNKSPPQKGAVGLQMISPTIVVTFESQECCILYKLTTGVLSADDSWLSCCDSEVFTLCRDGRD